MAAMLALTGCGSQKKSSSDNQISIRSSVFSGTVTDVSDDQITMTLSQGGMPQGMNGGQAPPEKPGDQQSGDQQSNDQQTPPERPDDQQSEDQQSEDQQTPPEKPESQDDNGSSGNAVTIVISIDSGVSIKDSDDKEMSVSDIEEGDFLTVTTDENGNVTGLVRGESQMQGGPGGDAGSEQPDEYSSVNTYTEDTTVKDRTLESTGKDESVTLTQEKATLNLSGVTVNRKNNQSTGGGTASFYGVGAAVLTTEGTTKVTDSKITTDSKGGAGVFAYGSGSTAYVEKTTIQTLQDESGGIHVAGGGTIYASDNTVTTEGGSSAAIRSDRGGGKMVVDGGSYTSNGTGSPAIYSTADITVNDAVLTSNSSEGVCIEGKNAIRLYDCDLTSSQTENEQNDNIWNMIVYQSMSGDAEEGEGTLIVDGGSITAKEGGLFYTTNTQSVITLSDVKINYPKKTDYFLRCTGNSNQRGWGSSGANGADCTFTADHQQMKGDIVYDSISNLDFYMVNGSKLTGAVVDDESCAGSGGDGKCNIVISEDSTWVVTADSTADCLSSEGKIVDKSGKTVTIKGTDGTVYVKGDSSLSVTVGSYSDKADTSGAQKTGSYSDYK